MPPRPRALLAILFANLVLLLGGTLPSPLYPLYEAGFHFGPAVLTIVYASYAAGTLGALLLVGRVSDEAGRRPVLLAAVGVAVLSTVTFLFAQGVGMLLVGRVLSGLSVGLTASTAAAYLVELGRDRRRAAVVAAIANLAGLGLGPLLSGLLGQFAPLPTRLTYAVLLGLLGLAALAVLSAPETVVDRPRGAFRLRPQLPGLPEGMARTFFASAVAVVAGFALLGLLTALIPTFLQALLQRPGPAVTGLMVSVLFVAGTLAQLALRSVAPQRTVLVGLTLLAPALVLVVAALYLSAFPLLVTGAVLGGAAVGLTMMGGQTRLNAAAPPARRAEVLTGFFVASYVGISLPVVGVGLLSARVGLDAAVLVLAVGIVVLMVASATLLLRRSGPEAHAADERAEEAA
jgi:MFS family permease